MSKANLAFQPESSDHYSGNTHTQSPSFDLAFPLCTFTLPHSFCSSKFGSDFFFLKTIWLILILNYILFHVILFSWPNCNLPQDRICMYSRVEFFNMLALGLIQRLLMIYNKTTEWSREESKDKIKMFYYINLRFFFMKLFFLLNCVRECLFTVQMHF